MTAPYIKKETENMTPDTSPSVLIVDDNTKNLQVLADILRGKKYKIATAKNGIKALKFINKIKPDIILLDIMMPEMDGIEVCQRLKQSIATKDIPVIFISALADTSDKIKGFEAGGVDYITKPFHKEEVFARVNVHLKLQKTREELKAANTLLTRANATKDKLFSIIAHDLRGPIGSLTGILETLVEQPDLLDRDQQSMIMNDFRISVKNTYHLLENLLSWANSQRGKITYHPENVRLADIIEANARLMSQIARDKSIQFYVEVPEDIYVYADPDMLLVVLRNLISNAFKFTPEFGQVKVTARPMENQVEICVSDTGVGISEGDMDKLFRFDINFTTPGTRNERGSGLGLLLCKEFVEKNGGTIWVESRKNEGSRFIVALTKPEQNNL
jgi:two-component system sensor histidine kinase/response regulator